MTDHYKNESAKKFKKICKEDVTVDQIASTIYVYGSELAVLRLFAKYNTNGKIYNSKVQVGIHCNGSHYFSITN